MRYQQPGGVKRHGEEYRVVVEVFLTKDERDMWGSGRMRLALVPGRHEITRPGDSVHPSGEIEISET